MRLILEILEQTLTECTTAGFSVSTQAEALHLKPRKAVAVVATGLREVERGVILEVVAIQGVGASQQTGKALASR
jgi:hypothetical protein